MNFDESLASIVRTYPNDFLPIFEHAIQQVYKTHYFNLHFQDGDSVPQF